MANITSLQIGDNTLSIGNKVFLPTDNCIDIGIAKDISTSDDFIYITEPMPYDGWVYWYIQTNMQSATLHNTSHYQLNIISEGRANNTGPYADFDAPGFKGALSKFGNQITIPIRKGYCLYLLYSRLGVSSPTFNTLRLYY